MLGVAGFSFCFKDNVIAVANPSAAQTFFEKRVK
jgi:hypothetical protein